MLFKTIATWVKEANPNLLEILRLTKYEIEASFANICGHLSLSQRRYCRKLLGQRGLRIHLSCGATRAPGWINVDVVSSADIRMDLRKRMPFADGSADMLFTEHFLDHLHYPKQALYFLQNCRRVLREGGRLRAVVHDGQKLAQAYASNDREFLKRSVPGAMSFAEGVNLIYRYNGFHQFIYDFESLEALLLRAGFREILRSTYGGSEILDLNLDSPGGDREVQSMYVEAIA